MNRVIMAVYLLAVSIGLLLVLPSTEGAMHFQVTPVAMAAVGSRSRKSALNVLFEIAGERIFADTGYLANLLMGQVLSFEPQHLHFTPD
jgi:hypothetical protein